LISGAYSTVIPTTIVLIVIIITTNIIDVIFGIVIPLGSNQSITNCTHARSSCAAAT
jgi:hypothetical protein